MCYELDWKVDGEPFGHAGGSGIAQIVRTLTKEQMPHFADMFPFVKHHSSKCFVTDNFVIFQIDDDISYSINMVGKFENEELISQCGKIIESNLFIDYESQKKYLPKECYKHNVFTYIGPCKNGHISQNHVQEVVVDWLNDMVLPYIEEMNKNRVLSAIPTPPGYDLNQILSNIFVLESEEKMIQGTCFNVEGIGLITCSHTLADDLILYKASNPTKGYPVKKTSSNETIDIARIEVEGISLEKGLSLGTADDINHMDHIAIAGFPNYRKGDSGILSPGLIIGYRMVSGIRRLLVNTPIIAGNSGGPVLNLKGEVIGIAVTGSDRMEDAGETENHGVVPIDTLSFL